MAQKHQVREAYGTGTFEIWRKVGDNRAVKALPAAFPSRDAALAHMAQNAAQLMGSAKGYGEEIIVRPDKVVRQGPDWRSGDIAPDRFMHDIGARGVEFGHWQDERQRTMNMAYDAMRDLADVTGIDPKALTFEQRLGLAFGARGNGGKQAGAAHYERDYAAVNLTKESGAGHLAHEWMHALDHYLGTVDDPKLAETRVDAHGNKVFKTSGREVDYASHRVLGMPNGQLPETVRAAYRGLMDAMLKRPEQVTVEATRYERQVARATETLKSELDSMRRDIAEQAPSYVKRKNAPASAAQLKEFDALAAKLLAGEGVETKRNLVIGDRGGIGARNENAATEALSALLKDVRGRSGRDKQTENGIVDRIARAMNGVASAQKLVEQAKASPTQTVMTSTDFVRAAAKLDEARSSPYWSTKHELAARAFSAYVEDKLGATNRESNYLAFGSDNKFYTPLGVKPFPEGAERQAINAKFDALFSAMREAGMVQAAPRADAALGAAVARAAGAPSTDTKADLDRKHPGWSDQARQASAEVRAKSSQDMADSTQVRDRYEHSETHTIVGKTAVQHAADVRSFGSEEKANQWYRVKSNETGGTVMMHRDMLVPSNEPPPARQAAIGDNGGPSDAALKTAAKLEAVAKRTIEKAQKDVDAPRLMNTARRARMGNNVVDRARQDIADAKTALKIAEALRNGEAGALSNVKSLADIRELRGMARQAEYATDRKLGRSYKEGGHGLKAEDVANLGSVKGYVRLSHGDVADMKAALAGKKGLSADFRTLERYAQMANAGRTNYETSDPAVFKAIANVANAIKKSDSLKVQYPHQAKSLKYSAGRYLDEVRDFNRAKGLAGTDAASRQAVLSAFLDVRAGKTKADPIKALEQKLIGVKIPGFFPTPEPLAKRMAELAEIKSGMSVLEPSAGTGRLADAAKAMGANVDAVEYASSLRDILAQKGHNLIASDFTELKAEPKYDRIVMNPPFEKGQDMAHVQRAYEMLKPGGKMVAIMGEGGFFRSDSQATAFRDWLSGVGGSSEKLPEGTFKESNTGVNTRLVTISKPAAVAEASLKAVSTQAIGVRNQRGNEFAPLEAMSSESRERLKYLEPYLAAHDLSIQGRAGIRSKDKGPETFRWRVVDADRNTQWMTEAEIAGKARGWSDAARAASAESRKANSSVQSAVEKALATSAAKVQGGTTLVKAGSNAPTAGGSVEKVTQAKATAESTQDWLDARERRIKESRAAGNKHLDELPRAVEGMRGVDFRNVHDPKERGRVRTVANTGEVVVDWADQYSAKKNLAETVTEGKKTVQRSWLAPTDLKDYVTQPRQSPVARDHFMSKATVEPHPQGGHLVKGPGLPEAGLRTTSTGTPTAAKSVAYSKVRAGTAKAIGLLAPVGIAAGMMMAANQAKAEGTSQVKAAAKAGAEGAGVMAGFVAAQAGVTYGLMKAGMRAATAIPGANAVMMAGGALHGALTAKPGERLAGAARGAWDMSLPGMVVNTAAATHEAIKGRVAVSQPPVPVSSPGTSVSAPQNGFAAANQAFKAMQQAKQSDGPALRGTQNPNNLAAIVENRKAKAVANAVTR